MSMSCKACIRAQPLSPPGPTLKFRHELKSMLPE